MEGGRRMRETNTVKKSRQEKKQIGQFFTDPRTAAYMASCVENPQKQTISVLDMGAGDGILSLALIRRLLAFPVKELTVTLAENDLLILPALIDTVNTMDMLCREHHIRLHTRILAVDYLLADDDQEYDIVIANPPYRKIRKDAPEAVHMAAYVSGQPNLYALFMAKGIEHLKENGQVVYIVPRSWTSGLYYQKVRDFLLQSIRLSRLLVFSDRTLAFSCEDVLQETMILAGRKTREPSRIRLDIYKDCSFQDGTRFFFSDDELITKDGILCLPENESQIKALRKFSGQMSDFGSYGYVFRTGPVVEFRNREYLSEEERPGDVPLIRGINIQMGASILFPIRTGKNQYISSQAESVLIPNQNTVMVRRLVPKESPRRMIAAPYFSGREKEADVIGIENHVNYLTRADGAPLSAFEVKWMSDLLQTEDYDQYFRATGGSTQINASDLNHLPLRGEPIKRNVEQYAYPCLNDARDILRAIGMPETLYNPRCVMTFCACAEVTDEKWKRLSEAYHTTHDIIGFINEHFPNKAGLDKQGYQPNSRETFRDETLHCWVNAAIMEARPGIPTNSSENGYRFTAEFAALVRTYHTEDWEDQLSAFRATHEDYKTQLKQVKALAKGYPVSFGGQTFELKRNKHNRLQKLILEEFAPRFAKDPELLYIGDATDRDLVIDRDRMQELGIHVFDDVSILPDVVLYDKGTNRILFVEAYSSTGEFTLDRVKQVLSLCETTCELSFITAFETTRKMLSVYPHIAWDTDIWVAEDASHMTHKNGDRFLGRTLESLVSSTDSDSDGESRT